MTMRPKNMAAKFMLSASTLRNYEAKGIIPPAERSPNGYRMYSDLHAAYLACIQGMAPAFGMEVTTEVLRCLHRGMAHEALWTVREKEVILYEEKARVEGLIKDIRLHANENQPPQSHEWFTINEASELTQVPKSTIRYWEQAGYVPAERDPFNRYRRYSKFHLLKIRLIQALRSSVYSEDTVQFKQTIAEVEPADLPGIMKIAENIRTYLDKVIEAQVRGIAYLYQLIRLTQSQTLSGIKPWEAGLFY